MIIFEESARDYHANPALGSSLLRDFMKSPQLYRDKMLGLVQNEETEAMAFGTLFHLAVLEPLRFADEVSVKPKGMNFATKEGINWRREHAVKKIISHDDYEKILRMTGRMPASVRKLLSGGLPEVVFRNVLSDIYAQCRADYWNQSLDTCYDLKTIKDIDDIDRSIFNRKYYVQARFYQDVIRAEISHTPQFRLIFAETAAPFRWRVVVLGADYTQMADDEISEALRGIAQCERDGDWSDEQQGIMLASPPAWTQQIEQNEDGEINV